MNPLASPARTARSFMSNTPPRQSIRNNATTSPHLAQKQGVDHGFAEPHPERRLKGRTAHCRMLAAMRSHTCRLGLMGLAILAGVLPVKARAAGCRPDLAWTARAVAPTARTGFGIAAAYTR